MRRAVVELGRFNVTLNELRVRDILLIVDTLSEVFDTQGDLTKALSGKKALVASVAAEFASIDNKKFTLADITLNELEELATPFENINREFFGQPDGNDRSPQQPNQTSEEFGASLKRSVASAISNAHTGALEYPWSLYIDVVKFLNEQAAEEN